jgi:mRNA interferase RelE/StbE
VSDRFAVRIKPSAAKQLEKLDRQAQRRIQAALELLSTNPRPPKAEMLTNTDRLLRIRTGDYRIIYQVKDSELIVLVIKIGHRGDIYRGV